MMWLWLGLSLCVNLVLAFELVFTRRTMRLYRDDARKQLHMRLVGGGEHDG